MLLQIRIYRLVNFISSLRGRVIKPNEEADFGKEVEWNV
jgi:hypothetical protein